MESRIMYLENKGCGELTGPGRIGRVQFSKSGKTLRYKGREFQSLKGWGYKSNYVDLATGEEFWISGPKRDGTDTLYPDRVTIDEDVREEYWREIRGLSGEALLAEIRSEGLYSRRKPDTEYGRGAERRGGRARRSR